MKVFPVLENQAVFKEFAFCAGKQTKQICVLGSAHLFPYGDTNRIEP